MDGAERLEQLAEDHGLGLCNITYCCTEVCPEHIQITHYAIIPEKERVVDEFHDPLKKFMRKTFGKKKDTTSS